MSVKRMMLGAVLAMAGLLCGCNGGGSGGGTPPPAAPGFTLTVSQGSLVATVPTSGNATFTMSVQVIPSGGFSGMVSFAASGLPAGVTAAFSPTSSVTQATLQLTVDTTAALGASTLTIQGTGPGTTEASTTVGLTLYAAGPSDKLPILATVEQQCRSIGSQGLTPLQEATAIAAFMQQQPEYLSAGVDPDDCSAWGILQNGYMHVVSTSPYPPASSSSTPSVLRPGSVPGHASAPRPHPAGAQAPGQSGKRPVPLIGGAANALPGSSNARLLHSFGPNFAGQDVINDLAGWMTGAGWTVLGGSDASIDVLRSLGGAGFFYLNAHGGGSDKTGTGTYMYSVSSSTVQSRTLDSDPTYQDDLKNDRITYLTGRNGETILGGLIEDWDTYYSITANFVQKYWSFSPNAVVWINACSSFGKKPWNGAFRFAVTQAGAGVYFGWDDTLSSGAAYSSARYFVDRCLGANKYKPESPAQRPFSWDLVYADMTNKGLTTGANGETLRMTTQGTSTPPALLAPSIRLIDVDEFAGTMKLEGAFGSDQDTVTVGGNPVQIQSWSPTEVVCIIPPNASGDVQAKVRNLKSNPRPLTEWDVPLQYNWVMPTGAITFNGTGILKYRLDVSGFRTQPGQAPTFLCRGTWPMQGSTFTITGTLAGMGSCTLGGNPATIPLVPSAGSASFFLSAPLIADANAHTGYMGLILGGTTPFVIQCPKSPPGYITPSFGMLQGQGYFFDSEEEGAPATDGPIYELAVTYDNGMNLQDLTYTNAQYGSLKISWQGVSQVDPPRPDAGI